MENLGERIKQAREDLSMSQKTLAGLLGVQTQTVWRWEKGEREPNWEMIQKIAKLLNAPLLTTTTDDLRQDISKAPLGLGYWGSVFDNIREVAIHGTPSEITLIYTLLKSGCEELAKVITKNSNNDPINSHVDIHQNNFGRDATVNFGSTVATVPEEKKSL